MQRGKKNWRTLAAVILLLGFTACSTPAPPALFLDAAAWSPVHSVELVGVSFETRYRPVPQAGVARDLMAALRRELETKGYRVFEPARLRRVEPVPLTALPAAQLAERRTAPAALLLAVHVDFLITSATYGDSNPPPEFEIAAEARVLEPASHRDLWRARAHVVEGGAGFAPRDPDYDRMRGLAELAKRLLATLPDAGGRPVQLQSH